MNILIPCHLTSLATCTIHVVCVVLFPTHQKKPPSDLQFGKYMQYALPSSSKLLYNYYWMGLWAFGLRQTLSYKLSFSIHDNALTCGQDGLLAGVLLARPTNRRGMAVAENSESSIWVLWAGRGGTKIMWRRTYVQGDPWLRYGQRSRKIVSPTNSS